MPYKQTYKQKGASRNDKKMFKVIEYFQRNKRKYINYKTRKRMLWKRKKSENKKDCQEVNFLFK